MRGRGGRGVGVGDGSELDYGYVKGVVGVHCRRCPVTEVKNGQGHGSLVGFVPTLVS